MNRLQDLFVDTNSIVHRVDGAIKLLFIIVWTFLVFQFNDARIFLIFILLGLSILRLAKIPFKNVRVLFLVVIIFTIFNSIFLVLITPQYGASLTNSSTIFFQVGSYKLLYETLWFALTLSLKYLALLPITLIFILTTHPSKFASSLNRIKLNYKIAYATSIALRYIPDIIEEFYTIKSAQQMKGIDFKSGNIFKKLKKYLGILIPLVSTSISRIDIIATGMELRCFSKYKSRTWYNRSEFSKIDYALMGVLVLLVILIVYLIIFYQKTFYYPFN